MTLIDKLTKFNVLICGVALLSSASAFAQSGFVRVTEFRSQQNELARGTRPSLSADGTAVLYATSRPWPGGEDWRSIQSVHLDRIDFDKKGQPSVNKARHIEFPTGAPAGRPSYLSGIGSPSMSADGSVVAITSTYEEMGPGSEEVDHVRIFTVLQDKPTLVFQAAAPKEFDPDAQIRSPVVSKNGNFVAFFNTDALQLYDVKNNSVSTVTDYKSNGLDFFLVVRGVSDDGTKILIGSKLESGASEAGNIGVISTATGKFSWITNEPDRGLEGTVPNFSSWDRNGVMTSFAAPTALVKGDTNRASDVYLTSTAMPKSLVRVSTARGVQGNFSSGQPSISPNGRLVAFISRADNLRANDMNYAKDLYVYSLANGSLASFVSGNEDIELPLVSDNGVVAFVSKATNFDPNDKNEIEDIFVGRPLAWQAPVTCPSAVK